MLWNMTVYHSILYYIILSAGSAAPAGRASPADSAAPAAAMGGGGGRGRRGARGKRRGGWACPPPLSSSRHSCLSCVKCKVFVFGRNIIRAEAALQAAGVEKSETEATESERSETEETVLLIITNTDNMLFLVCWAAGWRSLRPKQRNPLL